VRTDERLIAEIRLLAASDMSFADLSRHANHSAERLRVTRPSYDTVRLVARDARRRRIRARTRDLVVGGVAGAAIATIAAITLRRSC
jgi:hypothetical protein